MMQRPMAYRSTFRAAPLREVPRAVSGIVAADRIELLGNGSAQVGMRAVR
jgi:hypothetical protein